MARRYGWFGWRGSGSRRTGSTIGAIGANNAAATELCTGTAVVAIPIIDPRGGVWACVCAADAPVVNDFRKWRGNGDWCRRRVDIRRNLRKWWRRRWRWRRWRYFGWHLTNEKQQGTDQQHPGQCVSFGSAKRCAFASRAALCREVAHAKTKESATRCARKNDAASRAGTRVPSRHSRRSRGRTAWVQC